MNFAPSMEWVAQLARPLFHPDVDAERDSDGASFDEFLRLVPAGREASLVTDDEFHAIGVAGLNHSVGATHADGHRFFANDGFDRWITGGFDG